MDRLRLEPKLLGKYAKDVARFCEQRCVAASAARIFTTPEMQREFMKPFPRSPDKGNFVIPNGFDASERSLEPQQVQTLARDIVYAGEFYGARSLISVWRALAQVSAQDASLSGVRLGGKKENSAW
jgi:hypothetical protein